MTSTSGLIDALTRNLSPVRRQRHPVLRATAFVLLAAFVVAMLAVARGWRSDLSDMLMEPRFGLALAGSLLTGILGTVAAFYASQPGRNRSWLALPIPPLVLWLSTVGYQCLSNWVVMDPAGMRLGETAECFATLALTSLPLSLALFLMLRHFAWLNARVVTLAGSLAVAGFTSTALALFHPLDASAMILLFNFGVAVAFVCLGPLLRPFFASPADQPLWKATNLNGW